MKSGNKNAHNDAINSDVQKRCFALLLHAGYGERVRRAWRLTSVGASPLARFGEPKARRRARASSRDGV